MSYNRDLNSILRLIELRSNLLQRLQNNYNAMTQNQRGNLTIRIANGETAVRLKAQQIAQRHRLNINMGANINTITRRLITQLVMLRAGLPKNLVNART